MKQTLDERSRPVDLVDFIQTHLLTSLETSTLADFIQTHLSTQLVDFIQTHLSNVSKALSKLARRLHSKISPADLISKNSINFIQISFVESPSLSQIYFKHPSSLSACAHLDLSSLSISRCFHSSSCRTLANVTSKLHSLILSISSISFRKTIPKLTQNLTLS